MRRFCLASVGMLLVSSWASAQQPPPAAPAADKLGEVLWQWEKAMTGMQSMIIYCTRTTNDKTFGTVEEYQGLAKLLKSNQASLSCRGSLEMFKMAKGQAVAGVFEKYVCTGNFLYEYAPASKVIRVHEMALKEGQVADDNFFGFLFGMKALEVKQRYQMVYVPAKDNDVYHYVRILPKSPADKAEFSEARLVLSAKTFLPRQLWFQHPNGTEVTWDLPKVVANAELRPTDFGQPGLPAGWQFVRVPRDPQARLYRPGKQ
jgi:TIGR03009 family protein